jgi:hypothetical protein
MAVVSSRRGAAATWDLNELLIVGEGPQLRVAPQPLAPTMIQHSDVLDADAE